MNGISSADPDRLDQWAGTSRGLDQSLSMRQSLLAGVHREFGASSRWGRFDASQLIDSVPTYVGYNEQDAARTSQIAASFREADSSGGLSAAAASGGVVTVSSAELGRALVKKGMSISMQGSRAVGRALPEARVGRDAAGLIETVDGQPVDDYLRSVAALRAEQYRAAPDQRPLPPEERVTSVAMDRRTGEVFEGGPADVVTSAGESGISRIAHVGGREPDLGNRLDAAQDQIELAEAFHRGGEAAMVPGLVRAARANIAEIRAGGEGFDGLGRRLDSMETALNRMAGPEASLPVAGPLEASLDGLSPAQLQALRDYTDWKYSEVNGGLRGTRPLTESAQEIIRNLDSALASKPLRAPTTLVRSITLPELGVSSVHQLRDIVGDVFRQDGYLSMSTKTWWPGRPVHLHMDVPNDVGRVGGIYLEPISQNPGEHEVLLERGRSYVIKSAEPDPSGGFWNVYVELLPR